MSALFSAQPWLFRIHLHAFEAKARRSSCSRGLPRWLAQGHMHLGGNVSAAEKPSFEEVLRSRVEFVSDEGVVVLLLPDGQRRITTIPPRSVSLVRRLAALDKELDLEPHR